MPTTLHDTHIRNRFRVQPNHANNHQTLHGGTLMKWLDEVGAMSATRFAGQPSVTAGVDELNFERPIEIGDTALVEAYVFDAGRTSIRVALRAWRETPSTGETEKTTESTFTFVAIGDDGTPASVPELRVESEAERRLQERVLDGES